MADLMDQYATIELSNAASTNPFLANEMEMVHIFPIKFTVALMLNFAYFFLLFLFINIKNLK